jgi:hypothetical protein
VNNKIGIGVALFFVAAVLTLQGCGAKTEPARPAAEPAVSADNAGTAVPQARTATGFKIFSVYTDGKAPDNHFSPSGWMGDYGDIRIDEQCLEGSHKGTTNIKITYTNKATQGARWAGIYWQNPPNNWGTRPGGYDLTGAKKLTFWARGEKGGERIQEFKIGGLTGEYADSDVAGIGPVTLTTEWQPFTIDLDGKDMSSISGGFCWATNLDVNPEGAVFYLDDIRYE